MSITPDKLTTEQRVDFLARLREARALVLRDSESFHEAATVLEYIGQLMKGKRGNGLKAYEDEIVDLSASVKGVEKATVRRLCGVVREARNDAVHDGAYVRHLSSRLVDLLVLVEDAVMVELTLVEEVMVRNPVSAESWHLLTHVRREMLANSFSNIPTFVVGAEGVGKWSFLTDSAIMQFVRKNEEKDRLSMTVEKALSKSLRTEPATCCHPGEAVEKLFEKLGSLPLLVTESPDKPQRLVGILSAFDLL